MTHEQDMTMLAPSVDRAWRDDFIVELRLRDVPGPAITDALAEVETHCYESGKDAADAFGPAADHARALDVPGRPRWTPAQLAWTWTVVLLLVGGVWTILLAALPVARGEQVDIDVGLPWRGIPVGSLPAGPTLAVGIAAIVTAVVVVVVGRRTGRSLEDHLLPPRPRR